MAGRHPTPFSILKLKGTDRPDRHAGRDNVIEKEAKVATELDLPDVFYGDPVREHYWQFLIDNAPGNLLRITDTTVMMGWCDAMADFELALRHLGRESSYIGHNGNGAPCPSVWAKLKADAIARAVKFGGEMGMSPVSRAKVVTADDKDKKDAWGDIKKEIASS